MQVSGWSWKFSFHAYIAFNVRVYGMQSVSREKLLLKRGLKRARVFEIQKITKRIKLLQRKKLACQSACIECIDALSRVVEGFDGR